MTLFADPFPDEQRAIDIDRMNAARAAARRSDPETSHEAAAAQPRVRVSQRVRLLRVYDKHGGLIDEEAIELAQIRGGWRRCSELRQSRLIRATGETRETSSHVHAQVCEITHDGVLFLLKAEKR